MTNTLISVDDLPLDLAGTDLLIDLRAPKGRAENGEIASAVILPKRLVANVFPGAFASVQPRKKGKIGRSDGLQRQRTPSNGPSGDEALSAPVCAQ